MKTIALALLMLTVAAQAKARTGATSITSQLRQAIQTGSLGELGKDVGTVLVKAVRSGDPQAIALVGKFANKHGVTIDPQDFVKALTTASITEDERLTWLTAARSHAREIARQLGKPGYADELYASLTEKIDKDVELTELWLH